MELRWDNRSFLLSKLLKRLFSGILPNPTEMLSLLFCSLLGNDIPRRFSSRVCSSVKTSNLAFCLTPRGVINRRSRDADRLLVGKLQSQEFVRLPRGARTNFRYSCFAQ